MGVFVILSLPPILFIFASAVINSASLLSFVLLFFFKVSRDESGLLILILSSIITSIISYTVVRKCGLYNFSFLDLI